MSQVGITSAQPSAVALPYTSATNRIRAKRSVSASASISGYAAAIASMTRSGSALARANGPGHGPASGLPVGHPSA